MPVRPKGGQRSRSLWRMLVLLTVLTSASCFAQRARPRLRVALPESGRAPFAFHYQPVLSDEALAWYSRFEILVTHDPLPREQVERLHAAGTKLLLYEWSVAFYDARATDWQRSLHKAILLNDAPLTGGVGSPTAGAWYFDPDAPEHEFGRAIDLARRIHEIGYDGVFFDTTTVESVHPAARKEYEQRHPDTPYDAAFARFLIQLRRKMPSGILFTNQGYRSAPYYLPYVDWDLTESLITRSNHLRAWNDPEDPWNSIQFVMQTMIEPVAARYPHVRFGHLNYVDGANPDAIRVVAAASQLFGGTSYVAAPNVAEEADPIYFRNPGKATSDLVDREGKAAYRFYENGLIVVTSAPTEITIANPHGRGLRNHFTRELVCGDSITIPAAARGPRAFFFDFESSDCR